MARMHEVMNELHLSSQKIPEIWEPYFIAAVQKYSKAPDNQERFHRQWYRQLNRWLNFDEAHTEAVLSAAGRVAQSERLYDWSQFIRYLIFDSKIIRQDESILHWLLPKAGLGEDQDLFLLVSVLSGADRIVERYKLEGFEGKEIEAVFGLIRILMDRFYRLNNRWGIAASSYLTRLCWSKLAAFNGVAFECGPMKLPGMIYRNSRSGEWVMVAKPGQLYDKQGLRLPAKEESGLLKRRGSRELLIDESRLDGQNDVKLLTELQAFPEGIWETKFFNTETGGFVGNGLGPDGKARSGMRIFETGHWNLRVADDTPVLRVYLHPDDITEGRADEAIRKALIFMTEKKQEPQAVIAESWILDRRFLDRLPEEHPLNLFAEQFRLYPLPQYSDRAAEQVFGEQAFRQAIRLWPEDNIYQQTVKTMWREGIKPSQAGGYFIPDIPLPDDKNEK